MFAGGVSRGCVPQGVLGFHGYRFDDPMRVQNVDKATIEDKDRAYLRSQGFDATFVEQIFATPPEDLWRPSRAKLIEAGVLR